MNEDWRAARLAYEAALRAYLMTERYTPESEAAWRAVERADDAAVMAFKRMIHVGGVADDSG
jgi:hypothetical protein